MFSQKASIDNQLNTRENTIRKFSTTATATATTAENSLSIRLDNQYHHNVQEMKQVRSNFVIRN
jgi:hypothetical protein